MKKTIIEQIRDMGYRPKEGQTILVKYFGENLSQQVIDFVLAEHYVLQICDEEILLFQLSNTGSGIKEEVHQAIRIEDIVSVTVENYLMNYKISIACKEDTVVLSTQQKELSGMRFSGLISIGSEPGVKNWHADNLDATLAALQALTAG